MALRKKVVQKAAKKTKAKRAVKKLAKAKGAKKRAKKSYKKVGGGVGRRRVFAMSGPRGGGDGEDD